MSKIFTRLTACPDGLTTDNSQLATHSSQPVNRNSQPATRNSQLIAGPATMGSFSFIPVLSLAKEKPSTDNCLPATANHLNNSFMKKLLCFKSLSLAIILMTAFSMQSYGQLFWNGAGTWSTANLWSATNGGPYNLTWSTNSAIFNVPNSTITGAGVQCTGITANENVTVTASGTLGTNGTVATINVASGKIFDFGNQIISITAGTGFIKTGAGTIKYGSTGGSAYPGGYTLTAGSIIFGGGANVLGSGSLTINGGNLSASVNPAFINNRFTGITIGGNFSFGDATNAANISFGTSILDVTPMSLGSGTARTITLAGTGTYSLWPVISGSGSSLTLNATAAGTLLLGGNNTFDGGTTISGGTLTIGAAERLANVGTMTLNGGTFRTSASAAGFSETIGTLALTDNSNIIFGTGNHTLTFAASNGISWTSGKTLTITGWVGGYNGTAAAGTSPKLFIGNSASGLTAGQLAQIQFKDGSNFLYNATILSTGEVVPISIVTPVITLNDNSQITAGTIYTSSTDNILSQFRVNVTTNNATLNTLTFTPGGTFVAGNITNFSLYTSTTNTFPGGAALKIVSAAAIGSGGTVTFSSLNLSCAIGDRYFWITADLGTTTTNNGKTVNVPSLNASAFSFTTGIPAGTVSAGGTQTIYSVSAASNFFRSKTTGNWNSQTTWESSTSSGGPWIDASLTPTSAADVITILNGHTVTVTEDVTVDQIVVNGGGNVTINAGITWSVINGVGTDLSVSGTVQDDGTITGTNSVVVNNGGIMNISGTLTCNGGPGGVTIQSGGTINLSGAISCSGGASNAVTVNGALNLTGSGNIAITGSSQGTLAVSGTVSMSGSSSISTFRGAGGDLVNINSGGIIDMTGTSTISINGNGNAAFKTLAGSTLKLGPNASISGGGDFYLLNGASLEIGSATGITSATASGNILVTGGTRIYGGYNDAVVLQPTNTANFKYTGITSQVTGDGLPTTLNNLTIANTSGAVTPSNSSIQVNGTLSVLANATLQKIGTFTLTIGAGGVSNAGTIQLNGTTAACGEADAILIRSSVGGTQRAWTGAGTFSLTDVNVQDQAGSASITALSSTNAGNNGGNWIFIAGCTACTTITATVAQTNITCFGANDGTITVTSPSGGAGSGTYDYSKDGGSSWQTSNSFTGLTPATYDIQIRDQVTTSCFTDLGNKTITEPAILTATINKTDVTCNGAGDGTITISAPSGGSGSFEYSINSTTTWVAGTGTDPYTFGPLAPGSYTIRVRDAGHTSCVRILNGGTDVVITEATVMSASVNHSNVTCFGANNGTITIGTPSGGASGFYQYSINGGTSWDATLSNTGLTPGTYNVQIRDASHPSCVVDLDGVGNTPITEPGALSAALTGGTSICKGSSANLTVTFTGGTAPFTFHYNDGADHAITTSANPYTLTVTPTTTTTYSLTSVTDSHSCTGSITGTSQTVTLTTPSITCPGALSLEGCNTGAIATAGHPAYHTDETVISQSAFEAEGGTVNLHGCTLANISYHDAVSGTCTKTVTRTYTLVDGNENSTSCEQNITVTDTHGPVLSGVPADAAADCGSIPTAATVTASDDCSGVNGDGVVETETTTAGTCAGNYILHRTWTATDNCGNTTSATQNITVTDHTPPTLTGTIPSGGTGINACSAPAGPTAAQIAAQYTDNCSGPVTVVKSGTPTGGVCGWSVTYTYHITDQCGNAVASDVAVTYSGSDQTPPTLTGTLPTGGTGINACSAPAGPTTTQIAAQYTDNCSGPITVVKSGTPTGGVCGWSVTYTYHITDQCGNAVASDVAVTYSGSDQTPPALTGTIPGGAIGNVCKSAAPGAPSASSIGALYTDNCSSATATLISSSVTGTDCSWTATYTYSVKDACNNAAPNAVVTYTGGDTEAPHLTGTIPGGAVGNICKSAAPSAPSEASIAALYTDNCSSATATLISSSVTGTDCAWTAKYTYSVKDACNNAAPNAVVTYTGGDTEAPHLTGTLPGGPVGNACKSAAPGAPSASSIASNYADNCSSVTATLISSSVTGSNCNWTATYTYSIKDACNNAAANAVVVFTGGDTQAPVISCPSNQNVACDRPTTPANTGGFATANDNCDPNPVITYTDVISNGVGGNYVITRTWKATDACANSSTCVQTINIQDSKKPTITCPPDITVNSCTPGATDPSHTGYPVAADNCDPNPAVTYADNSDQDSNPNKYQHYNYTINRTWTVTDAAGNNSRCDQQIDVQDKTAPVITCPGDILLKPADAGKCSAVINVGKATATDNCSPVLVGGIRSDFQSLTDPYPVGTTKIAWGATDMSGNIAYCIQTITVVDNQNPVVTCPVSGNANRNMDNGKCSYKVNKKEFDATATDNCSLATLKYTVTGATTGTGTTLENVTFNKGVTTVTWTATDASGHSVSCSFTVTVTDNQFPVVDCPGRQGKNSDATFCTYKVKTTEFDATATDNCGIASLTYALTGATTGSGTTLANKLINSGVTHVTWTATDLNGKTSTCTFDVTVDDKQNPVITCKPNITRNANNGVCTYTIVGTEFNATATDNCGATLTYTLSGVTSGSGISLTGKVLNVGKTKVNWVATDLAGNTDNCSFDVTVVDNQKPVITCPPNQTTCKSSNGKYTITKLTASDNCGVKTISYQITGATKRGNSGNDASGALNVGTNIITWTVTDINGNIATCTTTIIVTNTPCTARENEYVDNNGKGQTAPVTTEPTVTVNPKTSMFTDKVFTVIVAPNPSTTDFKIRVESSSNELITIRIIDAVGRVRATLTGVHRSQLVTIGGNYPGGSYFAEVVQGTNHKTVKLIKLN